MQLVNATNFTAEIAQKLVKASQVTKVTGHTRCIGLINQQNRPLLTLGKVNPPRRMHDSDDHDDGVLVYTIPQLEISPNMLLHGAEMSTPLFQIT